MVEPPRVASLRLPLIGGCSAHQVPLTASDHQPCSLGKHSVGRLHQLQSNLWTGGLLTTAKDCRPISGTVALLISSKTCDRSAGRLNTVHSALSRILPLHCTHAPCRQILKSLLCTAVHSDVCSLSRCRTKLVPRSCKPWLNEVLG